MNAKPLTKSTQLWCAFAVMLCTLPLLLAMPATVTLGILATGAFAVGGILFKPLPGWLRLLLVLSLTAWVGISFNFQPGRDAGSALLLAMLSLKLSELRVARDALSVVGFALFAPFGGFLHDQGPLNLILTIPAIAIALALLAGLAKNRTNPQSQIIGTESLKLVGIATVIALPMALVGFWLFPRFPEPLWGLPENAMARTGISEKMSPGDWLELFSDDSPAFRVDFFGTPPSPNQMYWRGPVLSNFDGRSWTRARWQESVPLELPDFSNTASRLLPYEITLEPSDRKYLFALDIPHAVPKSSYISGDLTVLSEEPIRALSRWQHTAMNLQGYQLRLPRSIRASALNLPPDFNPRTLALAKQLSTQSSDEIDYVRRVLTWYNAELSYSLAAPPLGRHTADEFLFDTKIGYCEHFASSFTMLMRASGIPARVVTGYAGGYRNPIGNYWLIRQSDAHAWTEVWLEGRGWVRIDPTAAVAPDRIFDTVDDLAVFDDSGLSSFSDVGDWIRSHWNNMLLGYDAFKQSQLLRPIGIKNADPHQLGIAFSISLLIVMIWTIWWFWRDQNKPTDPLEKAWRAFARRLAKSGIKKASHESATDFALRAAAQMPAHAASISALSYGYNNMRYGRLALTEQAYQELLMGLKRFNPS